MKLSELILETSGFNYGEEIENLIFFENTLRSKLYKNKLLKADRELLVEALQIIRLGEYN